ncbi:Uncharacterised protein [Mycobacteroides abscessus]|nr:Uncharacterised protein [Mycobacteroides abscessus]
MPSSTIPPPGARRPRGARWSSAARNPVAQRITSAGWCRSPSSFAPGAHSTPVAVTRANIGRRRSTPLAIPAR